MPGIYPYKRRGVPTNFLSMVGVYPDTEDPVVNDPIKVVHDTRARRGESNTSGRLKNPTTNTLRQYRVPALTQVRAEMMACQATDNTIYRTRCLSPQQGGAMTGSEWYTPGWPEPAAVAYQGEPIGELTHQLDASGIPVPSKPPKRADFIRWNPPRLDVKLPGR